jgi:2-oxoglutarate ferredoxin oxidoreductase subunit alpha
MVELPLVAINIQRAGPSTGSPTKTEQGDLLAVLFGRHSESPIPIIAPCTPGDCFHAMLEAFHMAVKYMTPVIVLSDGYLANSSEPWLIPEVDSLPRNPVRHAIPADIGEFQPYARDPETLARPWAIPGTKGLEHRIGGLTKEDKTGNVSYDADNHGKMNALRKAKIAGIAKDYAPIEIDGPPEGEILIVGWGGTLGSITAAVETVREEGLSVSRMHLRHLNPFPSDLGEILGRFEKILLPELSDGHLALLLRAKYLIDIQSLPKIEGQPFKIAELTEALRELHASGN